MQNFDEKCCACMCNLPKDSDRKDDLQLWFEFTECCGMEDEHPRLLCTECSSKTKEFYRFKIMCVASRKKFKEWLSLEQTKLLNLKYLDTINTKHHAISNGQRIAKSDEAMQYEPEENDSNMLSDESQYQDDEKNIQIEVMDAASTDIKKNDINRLEAIALQSGSELAFAGRLGNISDFQAIFNILDSTETFRIKCKICAKICYKKAIYDGHMRSHQGLPPYPCERSGCTKTFTTYPHLLSHYNRHEGIVFRCQEQDCNKTFPEKHVMLAHIRKDHNPVSSIKNHVCEICGKVFRLKSGLRYHRKTHMDASERQFTCDWPNCGKRFIDQAGRDQHSIRHSGIKKFKCPHCDILKVSKSELKVHVNLHTKEREYPCKMCAKMFYSDSQMKAHFWNVHGKHNKFPCRYCNDVLRSEKNRKDHEEKHEPIECDICKEKGVDKKFYKRRAYLKHVERMHSENPSKSFHICETCGKALNSKWALKHHRYLHVDKNEWPFFCEKCDRHFIAKESFDHHKCNAGTSKA